jgi:hypothetical protein
MSGTRRGRSRSPACSSAPPEAKLRVVEFGAGHASQPTSIADPIERAAGRARVGAAGSIALASQLAAFAG